MPRRLSRRRIDAHQIAENRASGDGPQLSHRDGSSRRLGDISRLNGRLACEDCVRGGRPFIPTYETAADWAKRCTIPTQIVDNGTGAGAKKTLDRLENSPVMSNKNASLFSLRHGCQTVGIEIVAAAVINND